MGFASVGRVWTPGEFAAYLATAPRPGWCGAITMHHTAAPSLAQRPNGLTIRHIENIRDYYRGKGWASGPHLFVDDDQIFGMTTLTEKGIHASSYNGDSIGIEVLGDYDSENPLEGRGYACWRTAGAAASALLDWLGLPADSETVRFHREEPSTRKSCPGRRIMKPWVLDLVRSGGILARETDAPARPAMEFEWSQWDFRGERWCVPVYDFLAARGVPSETIVAQLKRRDDGTYYGSEFLEGAYYHNGTTWAPVRELAEIA